jgi:hypothetical protein
MLAVVAVAVVTNISEVSWIQRLTPLLKLEKVQIQSRVLEGNETVIFVETVFLLWRVSTSAFILLTFGLNVMMCLNFSFFFFQRLLFFGGMTLFDILIDFMLLLQLCFQKP